MKIVADCSTGKHTIVPFTEDEISLREQQQIEKDLLDSIYPTFEEIQEAEITLVATNLLIELGVV